MNGKECFTFERGTAATTGLTIPDSGEEGGVLADAGQIVHAAAVGLCRAGVYACLLRVPLVSLAK